MKPNLRFLLNWGARALVIAFVVPVSLFSPDAHRSTIREEATCDRRDRYHIRSLAFGIA